jgi:hypothetical protein
MPFDFGHRPQPTGGDAAIALELSKINKTLALLVVAFTEPIHVIIDAPPQKATGVDIMALPSGDINVGDTFTVTLTAVNADGSTNTSVTSITPSADGSVLTVAEDADASGVATATYTAVAAGAGSGGAVAVNPDGTETSGGTNNPFSVTVVEAVVDATQVNIA